MTGHELIRSAMRAIGVLGTGATPTGDEYTDGLEALNLLLDTTGSERLAILQMTEVAKAVDGGATYTVAPAGDFVAPTPARLEWVIYRSDGIDTPALREMNGQDYSEIADKASEGYPDFWWYQNGVLTIYPVPPASTDTLRIGCWTAVAQITNGAATITLPPGYAEMLKWNLAARLAPEYGVEVPPSVVVLAVRTAANVKRANSRPIQAESDLVPVTGGDIVSGT